MHQALQGATFHMEHIVPRSLGGGSDLDNLAWSCPGRNLHNAGRSGLLDRDTNQRVPVFNPRSERWRDHFSWDEFQIVPLTAIGRAMCAAFELNSDRRIRIRRAEAMFGLFPPETSSEQP